METNESISSIIKERVDAFKFKENIEPIEPELLHKRGIIIDCGSKPYMLQAEIYNAIKDLVFEQLELKTICFTAKKNHPYGWYQKFNRKSRWQK